MLVVIIRADGDGGVGKFFAQLYGHGLQVSGIKGNGHGLFCCQVQTRAGCVAFGQQNFALGEVFAGLGDQVKIAVFLHAGLKAFLAFRRNVLQTAQVTLGV